MTQTSQHIVDAKNLLCPMPVIRVQQAIESLNTGDQLTAICTDPGALHDIPAWARIHGHRVISSEQDGREYHIIVEVG